MRYILKNHEYPRDVASNIFQYNIDMMNSDVPRRKVQQLFPTQNQAEAITAHGETESGGRAMLYVSVDLSMGVAKRGFIMANRILTWMKFGGTHTLGNHHNYIVVFLFY